MEKSADAFRTISEVAEDLRLPQHVLRFWETRFPQIRPLKRAGGRRYYRPVDTVLLRTIRQLLYDEGYTIKGVQRLLKEQGARRLSGEGSSPGAERPFAEMPGGGDDGRGPEPCQLEQPWSERSEVERREVEPLGGSFAEGGDDGGRSRPVTPPAPAFAHDRSAATSQVVEPSRASAGDADPLREALAIVEECLGILRAVR